jgi:hypothetical protein
VDRNEKADTVARLLELGGYDHAIAFCNTKNMTDRLAGLLRMRGITCEAIHGDIQQRVREKTLNKFRDGQMRVLVAPMWQPEVWTLTMWTWCSTTTCPTRMSIISTASAVPAVPSAMA